MKYRKLILLKELYDTSKINICTESNSNFAEKGDSLCEGGLVGCTYCVCMYVLDTPRRNSQNTRKGRINYLAQLFVHFVLL